MIDPCEVPAVEAEELLARFIFSSRHIRKSNATVKPEGFIPHLAELSVTRHREAGEREIWDAGQAIASVRERTLYGRGDVGAHVFLEKDLSVQAAPVMGHSRLPDNPNHANVTGWPKDDKARQKMLAIEIAARAKFVQSPDS